MNKKTLEKIKSIGKKTEKANKKTVWVPSDDIEHCPQCFKVVGDKNRYKLVCTLGKKPGGMNVTDLTKTLKLKQPTVTHHLNILRSVKAVSSTEKGRQRIYKLNRDAHCFEECKIPF